MVPQGILDDDARSLTAVYLVACVLMSKAAGVATSAPLSSARACIQWTAVMRCVT
jgi:hypothetical protein